MDDNRIDVVDRFTDEERSAFFQLLADGTYWILPSGYRKGVEIFKRGHPEKIEPLKRALKRCINALEN